MRLAQVFGNLLSNAAKFTPPGGRIDVSIARLSGRVQVSVRDDGRGIAQEHGGRIAVKSDGPGRGSTFSVELPTVSGAAGVDAASAAAVAGTPRGSFRVLVVDDNSDVASLLAEALRHEGYDATAEHDGRSALQTWRRFAPHAGVLDVGLPDLDGYELVNVLDQRVAAAANAGSQASR